jgi:antitoxin YefM
VNAITYTDARNHLAETMDRVTDNHEPIIITRRNGKNAVLISLEDFNAWQETEYLLRSPANAVDLMQAAEEIRERRNFVKKVLIEE